MIAMDAIVCIDAIKYITFGMHVDHFADFLALQQTQIMGGASFRYHRRSPLSSKETPLVAIDVIFPNAATELEQVAVLKHLRRHHLPEGTFFGFKNLMGASDALILECNGGGVFHKYWPLCTQALLISAVKFLLSTDASVDTWSTVLEQVYRDDKDHAATRLKCKPSRHGGLVLAAPAASTSQVSANKRRGGKSSSAAGHIAEIVVHGDLGREDGVVLDLMMAHVCTVDPPVSSTSHSHSRFHLYALSTHAPLDDRLRPRLPPLVFSSGNLLPADWHGVGMDVPVQFYRRQRLLRAVCSVRGSIILPPALSVPRPLPSSSQVRRGQYMGDISVITWNTQALLAVNCFKHDAKSSYVHKLMGKRTSSW